MADTTGGNRSANFIADIDNSVNRLNLSLDGTKQRMSSIKSLSGGVASNIGGGGASASANQVAPNPVFSSRPALTYGNEYAESSLVPPNQVAASASFGAYGPTYPGSSYYGYYGGGPGGPGGSNVVAASPSGGGGSPTNLTSYLTQNPLAGALYAAQTVSNAFYSTSDMVQSQLLMQRASFYSGQGKAGGVGYGGINTLQSQLSSQGASNSAMDAMNALVAAQSIGLSGAQNFLGANGSASGLMQGVAAASNLSPGAGLEGTTRATAAMQMGSSVNMLKGIGIQLRDTQGNMTAPDKVIDQIWDLICKDYKQAYGSAKNGGKPTLKEVQIGLQSGNSLDSMLNQYFGSDPILKQMVMNGLLYKAQGGGSISDLTPTAAAAAGLTTEAAATLATKNAASATTLGTVSASGALGFSNALNEVIIPATKDFNNVLGETTAKAKAYADTLLSAANGTVGKLLSDFSTGSALSSLISKAVGSLGKASGGPVAGATTYIVGEKGPELFTPATSGTITPNNQLSSMSVGGGQNITMNIHVPHANTPEVINALKDLMNNVNSIQKASEG